MNFRSFLAALILAFLLASPVHAQCSHEFVEKREEPTCAGAGVRWFECIHCGLTTDYKLIPALPHEFSDWYIIQEPTCTQEGIQARDCVNCTEREYESVPHLGHEYVVEVEPPTCTARGYTLHYCLGCGDRFRTDYTEPLGHRYDDGVILRDPTLTAMGRILYTCLGCGDTYQETIPVLTNPFEDIHEEAYYFLPVLWAVYRGITSGMDETHFAPNAVCNRAQVVTFLWRAAGKPEPELTENPFEDVPKGSFYEKAVLWAYDSGITTGVDECHFAPMSGCNRAQVVTFLHRFRGCPEPAIANAFPDVPEGSFYHKAVLWAAQRQITVGMDGGNFCPFLRCTRGQIVTFIYRDEKNP